MYRKFVKVLFDYIFGLLLSPLILIIFFVVFVVIKINDRGPVFYYGSRLGQNGNVFKMRKFRTMKVNAPDLRNTDGSTFSSDSDVRLTKVGRILRKSSLDELPQIANIILGQMSFIGPRPDLPEAFGKYSEHERKKLLVKPGITGYSQAYYRNSITASEKFQNDIYYVENLSFKLDLKITFKTISSVLKHKNIYSNNVIRDGSGISL